MNKRIALIGLLVSVSAGLSGMEKDSRDDAAKSSPIKSPTKKVQEGLQATAKKNARNRRLSHTFLALLAEAQKVKNEMGKFETAVTEAIAAKEPNRIYAESGVSLLHAAANLGNEDLVEQLLRAGASITSVTESSGSTVLMYALYGMYQTLYPDVSSQEDGHLKEPSSVTGTPSGKVSVSKRGDRRKIEESSPEDVKKFNNVIHRLLDFDRNPASFIENSVEEDDVAEKEKGGEDNDREEKKGRLGRNQ